MLHKLPLFLHFQDRFLFLYQLPMIGAFQGCNSLFYRSAPFKSNAVKDLFSRSAWPRRPASKTLILLPKRTNRELQIKYGMSIVFVFVSTREIQVLDHSFVLLQQLV